MNWTVILHCRPRSAATLLALITSLVACPAIGLQHYRATKLLGGGPITVGFDINNRGDITGGAYAGPDGTRAFIYSNGVMHDLGTSNGTATRALRSMIWAASLAIPGWSTTLQPHSSTPTGRFTISDFLARTATG